MTKRSKKILHTTTAALTSIAFFYCQVIHAYAMPVFESSHYVTVTEVADRVVTYRDSSVGPQGIVNRQDFAGVVGDINGTWNQLVSEGYINEKGEVQGSIRVKSGHETFSEEK